MNFVKSCLKYEWSMTSPHRAIGYNIQLFHACLVNSQNYAPGLRGQLNALWLTASGNIALSCPWYRGAWLGPQGFGDLGKMAIYFQGACEAVWRHRSWYSIQLLHDCKVNSQNYATRGMVLSILPNRHERTVLLPNQTWKRQWFASNYSELLA